MAHVAVVEPLAVREKGAASGRPFALAALALMIAAAILAGWMPLGLSLAVVFICAGPHNWIEARYFLARLPARWGRLRGFFLLSFLGIFSLTVSFALLPTLARACLWQERHWLTALAVWNSVLVLWVAALIVLRSRQNPRRDWSWAVPAAGLFLTLTWIAPQAWDLGLVYLHPLIALWILDRELRRTRPTWRPAYHAVLACLPLVLGLLWWKLVDAPNLPGTDALTERITHHAGADILQGLSSHLLVATHTFLETLHYGVWLLAIPLASRHTSLGRLADTPLGRRSPSWARGLRLALLGGAALVVLLWACFLADYPATRDVYFTVALAHVLAEVPFLLRAL